MIERIPVAVPQLRSERDAALRSDLRLGVEEAVTRFLDVLGTPKPALTGSLKRLFMELGAGEAREDRGFDVILAVYNHAGRTLYAETVRHLSQEKPLSTDVMLELSEAIFTFTDTLAAASVEGYTVGLRLASAEQDRRRQAVAKALLQGRVTTEEMLDEVGWHGVTQCVLAVADAATARELRMRLGNDALICEEPDVVALVVRADREQLLHRALDERRVTVSGSVTLRDAAEAWRLAHTVHSLELGETSQGAWPRRVDEHLADVIAAADPAAVGFVRDYALAGLRDVPASTSARLVETLASWAAHWGNRQAVAQELHIHPQTVSYRIAQARELLGDIVDDPRRRLTLLMALHTQLRSMG